MLECSKGTTLDDFGNNILVKDDCGDYFSNKVFNRNGDVITPVLFNRIC